MIKKCTYCGSKEAEFWEVFSPEQSEGFVLKCSICGAETERFPTKEEAEQAWSIGKIYKK